MPMRSPGPSRDAPLMMRRQGATLHHKAKRGLRCQPGKPLRGIWCKWEQAVLRADHHVASLWPILDARQDMSWLAERFGWGTRERGAGGVGLGGRLAVLVGFVGVSGMADPGSCCVMRRVRAAAR